MKKQVLALVVGSLYLSISTATAQTTSNIYDLQYLPKTGTIYGETFLTTDEGSSKIGSTEQENYKTSIQQFVGYSVTNSILAFAGIDYLLNNKIEPNDINSKGLGDPLIGARVRLTEQSQSGLNFDIVPKVKVGLEDRKDGGSKDGNNKQGGQVLELGLNLGKKLSSYQFNLFLNSVYFGKSDVKDADTNDKSKIDSRINFELGASALYNLNESTFISGTTALTRIGEIQTKDSLGKTTLEDHYQVSLAGEIGFTPVQNLLLSFGGKLIWSEQYSYENGSDINNELVGQLTLRSRYQF